MNYTTDTQRQRDRQSTFNTGWSLQHKSFFLWTTRHMSNVVEFQFLIITNIHTSYKQIRSSYSTKQSLINIKNIFRFFKEVYKKGVSM